MSLADERIIDTPIPTCAYLADSLPNINLSSKSLDIHFTLMMNWLWKFEHPSSDNLERMCKLMMSILKQHNPHMVNVLRTKDADWLFRNEIGRHTQLECVIIRR